jgi:hypothetical protein
MYWDLVYNLVVAEVASNYVIIYLWRQPFYLYRALAATIPWLFSYSKVVVLSTYIFLLCVELGLFLLFIRFVS